MKLVSATINYGSRTAGQYDLVRGKAIIIQTKYPGHKTSVNGLTLTNLLIQTARPFIFYPQPGMHQPKLIRIRTEKMRILEPDQKILRNPGPTRTRTNYI